MEIVWSIPVDPDRHRPDRKCGPAVAIFSGKYRWQSMGVSVFGAGFWVKTGVGRDSELLNSYANYD